MQPSPAPQNLADPAAFIARWQKSGAAERANYQLFLSELCDVLGVPRPDPTTPDNAANAYVFERAVTFQHGDGTTSTGRIDLYRRQCFVLEAKQGANTPGVSTVDCRLKATQPARKGVGHRGSVAWDDAMLRARGQAEQYARALPTTEGRPPFLLVVDVGHSIEIYSEFSRTGGTYTPFPAAGSHRLPDARTLHDVRRGCRPAAERRLHAPARKPARHAGTVRPHGRGTLGPHALSSQGRESHAPARPSW